MDPFTLKKLAGHVELNTTMRYVHLDDEDVRTAMRRAQGRHNSGHTGESADMQRAEEMPASETFTTGLDGATRRSRTGDPLITN